jgi:D-alanyl-D-alanine carboxypeptidase
MNAISRVTVGRVLFLLASGLGLAACGGSVNSPLLPDAITQVMNKPVYRDSTWSLRVVDLASGQIIYDQNAGLPLLIGSVRKLFSVGSALNELGAQHTFTTPVYAQGTVNGNGTLNGNLVLVASGDLLMGGRTNPDGTVAITDLDHNEANSIGNAILSAPDPLAGYDALAAQVAAAGIRQVSGEVIIDDRLFQPFDFRGEFDVRPIFVNDDVVDVIIGQGSAGAAAPVDWRPESSAFTVQSSLTTGPPGSALDVELAPELPACIGSAGCTGLVSGNLPADLVPALTGQFPLIRTFRITEPSNYARTVFIEALERAGVTVAAPAVEANPVQLLPATASYAPAAQVAQLVSQPYAQYAKLILKVSYNIGADESLVLFGLAWNGANSMSGALAAEQIELPAQFGVPVDQLHFVDGSGGGDTTATGAAIIAMLRGMAGKPVYAAFVDALPILATDGSLAMVTDFESDPTLAGAKGQVYAKTGTYVVQAAPPATGLVLKGQSLAGYIDAKSGRRLAFELIVNDVPVGSIDDVVNVFQDEGTIAAIVWKLQ